MVSPHNVKGTALSQSLASGRDTPILSVSTDVQPLIYGWVVKEFAPMMDFFLSIPAPIMGTFLEILPPLGEKTGHLSSK